MRKHCALSAAAALLLALALLLSGCGVQGDVAGTTAADGLSTAESAQQMTENTTAAPSKDEKLIALTFDDGPNAATSNRILDLLEQYQAHATFFVCGYCLGEKGAEVLKRQVALGCEIGNHTKDHKTLTKLSASGVAEQVNYVNDRVKELTGYEVKLLRAPGGAYKGVLDWVNMPFIQWSIDTNDWRAKDASHPDRTQAERTAKMQEIAELVFDSAEAGDIVLMHDIYEFTADLCGLIIPGLVERGFRLVTVSEMFAAYGETLKPSTIYFNVDVESAAAENAPPLAAGVYRVATKSDPLNLRAEPNGSAAVITKIPKGATVTVTEAVEGWAYVTYDGKQGWVSARFLKAAA